MPKDPTGSERQKRFQIKQRHEKADLAVIRILHAVRDLERQYRNMSPEEKGAIPLYISCFLEGMEGMPTSRSKEGSS